VGKTLKCFHDVDVVANIDTFPSLSDTFRLSVQGDLGTNGNKSWGFSHVQVTWRLRGGCFAHTQDVAGGGDGVLAAEKSKPNQ
jgi:hypothetical protein